MLKKALKKIRMSLTKEKVVSFVKENKWQLLQMGVMAAIVFVPEVTAFALENGKEGLGESGLGKAIDTPMKALSGAMTGAIPKAGVTIAAATGGLSWALGTENQVVKYALRAGMGGGIAMAAPSVVNSVTGVTTGFLF